MKKIKDKPATLADQIKVIERMIKMYEGSYKDGIGKYKGQIRPSEPRREYIALKAAWTTLDKIWHLGEVTKNTLTN
jgi:hypothetical protein